MSLALTTVTMLSSVLLLLVMTQVRVEASRYSVEGCFSGFPISLSSNLGVDNSNIRCQDKCRDKGYILAATKGMYCMCGNIYPKGLEVDEISCRGKCRAWLSCHSVQSCCGGSNAYTVSVVGNIDVAKQVLRRLGHVWQTNTAYRTYMKETVKVSSPTTRIADWWKSFDKMGWSRCGSGSYMTGLWRSGGGEGLSLLEEAECRDPPSYLHSTVDDMDCYDADWWGRFDKKGWVKCKNGYYMRGLYRTKGNNLHNLEEAQCCRPKSQLKQWGSCYNADVWGSFDKEGWSKCKKEYFMAGLYRSSCDELYCVEEFYCCKMGKYNGQSWIENPVLSINVKDASGTFKHCSMNALDKTSSSTSYKCKALAKRTNMLNLNAKSFTVEEETPLNVAKPQPIKGFRPVTCSPRTNLYSCTKSLSTSIETTSSLTIGSGFSTSVTIGASVEISAGFLGAGTKSTFQSEVSATASLNVESSSSKTYTTTESTDVTVKVPSNTEVTINMMRTVQDLEYKWKAVFQLLGKYSAKWKNGYENVQDVTTVLSGPSREMYAFGRWSYPGTDVITVLVTDKYATKGCTHEKGTRTTCSV